MTFSMHSLRVGPDATAIATTIAALMMSRNLKVRRITIRAVQILRMARWKSDKLVTTEFKVANCGG